MRACVAASEWPIFSESATLSCTCESRRAFSETAAASVGINPTAMKTAAFGIAAAFAGFAGGFFAPLAAYINPESFPLLTSIIMRTFGWQVLFARRGLVNQWLVTDLGLLDAPLRLLNTPGLAIAALVHVLVPFAVLSIASVLQGIDRRLEEGALMLGASRFRTFWEVTLPLTMDGIGTGAILVFMIANGSFVTLVLLGGGFQTLPLLIYQQFNTTRDFALASTMSTILLVIALACLWLQLRLVRRQGV